MSDNAISLLDFTLSCESNTYANVRAFCDAWCKQWVFQKEKSDTGYEHWQLRFSAIKKRRIKDHIYNWRTKKCGLVFSEKALTPTSNSVFEGAERKVFKYVLKEDTRVEGPWSDKDEVKILTKSVQWIKDHGLDPWMREVVEISKTYDHRHINVMVDKVGNSGKTTFEDWFAFEDHGFDIWFGPIKDMEEEVAANCGRTCYTINLPRALNKKEMSDFWQFVERLKDGRMRDARYKSKRRKMERPVIWIFTNDKPDLRGQSADRWKFYEIENEELVVMAQCDSIDE